MNNVYDVTCGDLVMIETASYVRIGLFIGRCTDKNGLIRGRYIIDDRVVYLWCGFRHTIIHAFRDYT